MRGAVRTCAFNPFRQHVHSPPQRQHDPRKNNDRDFKSVQPFMYIQQDTRQGDGTADAAGQADQCHKGG